MNHNNFTFTHQLQFDNDKYEITKELFNILYSGTNEIKDYKECRRFVRLEMNKNIREVKQVREFKNKKIDIHL